MTDIVRPEGDSSMVDECGDALRHRARLATVECDAALDNRLPDVCVGCGLAGKITGVEFVERGVHLVDVEDGERSNTSLRVDFGDAQQFAVVGVGPWFSTEVKGADESEALAAGGEDFRGHRRRPHVSGRLYFREHR